MEELKIKLYQAANESGLPLEAIYFVAKDFFRDVDATYQNYLRQVEEAKNAATAQAQAQETESAAAEE